MRYGSISSLSEQEQTSVAPCFLTHDSVLCALFFQAVDSLMSHYNVNCEVINQTNQILSF